MRIRQRVPAYQNDGQLFAAELQIEANNPYALAGLGKYLLKQGQPAKGLGLWIQGVKRMPKDVAWSLNQQSATSLLRLCFCSSSPSNPCTIFSRVFAHGKTNIGRSQPMHGACSPTPWSAAVNRQ